MASSQTKNSASYADGTFESVEELSERLRSAARQAGNLYLDAYDKSIDGLFEVEQKLAGLTQQEWLKDVIKTQAEITREIATLYTDTARGLLK